MSSATGPIREETLQAIEGLASGAAHHLNNLLAVIVGHLQLALVKAPSADIRRHLAVAERAAQESATVIRQLATFSGAHLAPLVPVDLNHLAAEVLESTRRRFRDGNEPRGARIDLRFEAGQIQRVDGDPVLLREVLENLVLNAIDAMPDGGTITIRTSVAGSRVRCAVSDTGTGMTVDVRRRALEPFFTTKGVDSTGLGLSVSYGIIRGHGGDLTIESAERLGTTATFNLPVAAPGGRVPAVEPAPEPSRALSA